jgi:hypothetical protein
MYEWMTHKGYLAIVYFEEGFHISQIKNLEPSKGFTLNYNYETFMVYNPGINTNK